MSRAIYKVPILLHYGWPFVIVILKNGLLTYWWKCLSWIFLSDYLWGSICFLCNLLVVGLLSWIIDSQSFSFSSVFPDVFYSAPFFSSWMINYQPSSYWHIWLFLFLETFSSFGFSFTTLSCFLLSWAPSPSLSFSFF